MWIRNSLGWVALAAWVAAACIVLGALLVAALAEGPQNPTSHDIGAGGVANLGKLGSSGPYRGISNIAPGASFCYSLRACSDSNAANNDAAILVRRASDDSMMSVNVLASGDLDIMRVAGFCGQNDCFVVRWYDQTPNANHAVQPANGAQPRFMVNCINTRPCVVLEQGRMFSVMAATGYQVAYQTNGLGPAKAYQPAGISKTRSEALLVNAVYLSEMANWPTDQSDKAVAFCRNENDYWFGTSSCVMPSPPQ